MEQDIKQEIKSIIEQIMKGTPFDENTNFTDVFDSLKVLEFASAVEKKFHIRISDEDLFKMTDLNTTIEILKKYIK